MAFRTSSSSRMPTSRMIQQQRQPPTSAPSSSRLNRLQNTEADPAEQATNDGIVVFTVSVPTEILMLILENSAMDRKSLASIARSSRAFHSIAMPILYSSCQIMRTREFLLFQRTMAHRPELGALVKSYDCGLPIPPRYHNLQFFTALRAMNIRPVDRRDPWSPRDVALRNYLRLCKQSLPKSPYGFLKDCTILYHPGRRYSGYFDLLPTLFTTPSIRSIHIEVGGLASIAFTLPLSPINTTPEGSTSLESVTLCFDDFPFPAPWVDKNSVRNFAIEQLLKYPKNLKSLTIFFKNGNFPRKHLFKLQDILRLQRLTLSLRHLTILGVDVDMAHFLSINGLDSLQVKFSSLQRRAELHEFWPRCWLPPGLKNLRLRDCGTEEFDLPRGGVRYCFSDVVVELLRRLSHNLSVLPQLSHLTLDTSGYEEEIAHQGFLAIPRELAKALRAIRSHGTTIEILGPDKSPLPLVQNRELTARWFYMHLA